jgi:hypothetical protein
MKLNRSTAGAAAVLIASLSFYAGSLTSPASAGVSYATQAQVSAAQATATKALAAAKADAAHLNSVVNQIKACFQQFPASPPCP